MSVPLVQIPTSTTIVESAVIRSSLAQVWALVNKLPSFSQFTVKQNEFSASGLNNQAQVRERQSLRLLRTGVKTPIRGA